MRPRIHGVLTPWKPESSAFGGGFGGSAGEGVTDG